MPLSATDQKDPNQKLRDAGSKNQISYFFILLYFFPTCNFKSRARPRAECCERKSCFIRYHRVVLQVDAVSRYLPKLVVVLHQDPPRRGIDNIGYGVVLD